MLKIAHITPFFDPEYYGSQEHLLSLELKKLGNDITIITSDRHSLWGGAIGQKDKFKLGYHSYNGLRILRLRSYGRVLFTPLVPDIYKHLNRIHYDIILTHEIFHFVSFLAALSSKKHGIPLILFQHGYSKGRNIIYQLLFFINFYLIGKYILNRCSQIFALSSDSKKFIDMIYHSRKQIDIIPNGVDLRLFHKKSKQKRYTKVKRILYVGRLIKEKGIFLFMDVCKEIIREYDYVVVLIVGSGPEEEKLKQYCKDYDLIDRVIFKSRVKQINMPDIYNKSTILVLPTLISEPFGNVVIEAMACGLPVIGSKIGGINDIIIDGITGYHITPGSQKELKEKMICLIENEKLMTTMSKNARHRVEQYYSPEKLGSIVDDALRLHIDLNANDFCT